MLIKSLKSVFIGIDIIFFYQKVNLIQTKYRWFIHIKIHGSIICRHLYFGIVQRRVSI